MNKKYLISFIILSHYVFAADSQSINAQRAINGMVNHYSPIVSQLSNDVKQLEQEGQNITERYAAQRRQLAIELNEFENKGRAKAGLPPVPLIMPRELEEKKHLKSTVVVEEDIHTKLKKEEARKGYLKNKYQSAPTIHINDITIYDVEDINYFRNDKTKIVIKGKEQSYFFPVEVLKEAKLINATDILKQKISLLTENKLE